MKRISPISKKTEIALRKVIAAYPTKEFDEIHKCLSAALFSRTKDKSHDFRVIASLFNNSLMQLRILKSLIFAIGEIDQTGYASPKSLDAIMDAAGYELEENGHALRAKKW